MYLSYVLTAVARRYYPQSVPRLGSVELLKFRLLADGVHVRAPAARAWTATFGGPYTLNEYPTTSGLCLELSNGVFANCAVSGESSESPLPELDHDDSEGFWIEWGGIGYSVRPVPVAEFHFKQVRDSVDGRTRSMDKYAVTHTDRCRVSPISGCAYRCRFCNIPYELAYRKKDVSDLLNVVRAAITDPMSPARHVVVSGGTPRSGPKGGDEAYLDLVIGKLVEQSGVPVEVMLSPRKDDGYPFRLRELGVEAISANLELFSSARRRTLTPQKWSSGRGTALRFIARAVDAFGVGAVRSMLVFGPSIEPLHSTLDAVRALVDVGCVPVLSPFKAHPSTPLRNAASANLRDIIETYLAACEIVRTSGDPRLTIGPSCLPCQHNVAALPWAA